MYSRCLLRDDKLFEVLRQFWSTPESVIISVMVLSNSSRPRPVSSSKLTTMSGNKIRFYYYTNARRALNKVSALRRWPKRYAVNCLRRHYALDGSVTMTLKQAKIATHALHYSVVLLIKEHFVQMFPRLCNRTSAISHRHAYYFAYSWINIKHKLKCCQIVIGTPTCVVTSY